MFLFNNDQKLKTTSYDDDDKSTNDKVEMRLLLLTLCVNGTRTPKSGFIQQSNKQL